MSKHRFNTTYQGRAVLVTLGFDRPLQHYFLDVEHLDGEARPEHLNIEEAAMDEDSSDFVYISLYDPDAPRDDLEFFRQKLRELGIEVPEVMFRAVAEDKLYNVGNKVIEYPQDAAHRGKKDRREPIHYLGRFESPWGWVHVFRRYYPNLTTAIRMYDDQDKPIRMLSVNLAGASELLGPDEFFVGNWSENEPLIASALASGLFEDTRRKGPPTGVHRVCPPIWRICDAASSLGTEAIESNGETFYVKKEIEGEDCVVRVRPTLALAVQELCKECAHAADEEIWSVWSSHYGIVVPHQRAAVIRERWGRT